MDSDSPENEYEYLSPQDVAAMLRVAVSTARDLIRESGAPVFRTSAGKSGGIMRVHKLLFLAWLDSQTDAKRASVS